jgi:hypothetical protein
MTRTLITFGDSWPGNAENGSAAGYGQILADTYGFDQFYNYGTGGASNEDMLFQFQQHIRDHHRPDHIPTAIFFLTNPERTVQWPKFMSMQSNDPDMKKVVMHLFSNELTRMRNMSAVSTLQYWCQNLGFDDWYFAGWNRYEHWVPGVKLDRIWARGKETAADWLGATKHNGDHLLDVGDNPYIRPNFCHPNPLGHQLIADRLAQWIGLNR